MTRIPRPPLAPLLSLALALAGGARAEPPPALIEATEAASAQCQAAGGRPEILDRFETVLDLNGDGRDDYLTDLARMQCVDAWGAFCGASGCPVTAWLSTPAGGFDRFDFGRLVGFEVRDDEGPLPSVVARYDTPHCGEDVAEGAGCSRSWVFTTNNPPEPPAEMDVVDVVAAGPRSSAGWTLRNVPGASPMAVGPSVGPIASLAAFCLSGQPFLAVTVTDRPPAEAATLRFGFRGGAVEARAGFEETAGGAYVVALAGTGLAERLAGRDSSVPVALDGTPVGVLSLSGSTRALRGALGVCKGL